MSTTEEQLREELVKLYNESRQMGMLRTGSPIDHMVDGALALLSQHTQRARVEWEKELTEAFQNQCHATNDGDCKYFRVPEGYDRADTILGKFFPQELLDTILAQLSTKDSTNKEDA